MNDQEKIAALEAENKELKQQIADMQSGLFGVPKELREMVTEKRKAGLDLATAIKSAQAQVEWDSQQADDAKKAKKKSE